MKPFFASLLFILLVIPTHVDAASISLSGRILLAVEERGAAWYVNPTDGRRVFLGRPENAWSVLRELGLGVSNADLAKIPTSSESKTGDTALRQRLAGRILLQVESRGEAWYVDPITLQRAYLGKPEDAFRVMRSYGLGISSRDLAQVPARDSGIVTTTNEPPFVTQAPFGNWADPRQQEGCEEASVLMAIAWAKGTALTSADAEKQITAMADWEQKTYGTHYDTSAQDTADRLLKTYASFKNISVSTNIGVDDIKKALADGNVVLATVDAQQLKNPHYGNGSPTRHMLLIHGYDAGSDTFITHDPGTRFGKNFRYSASIMAKALKDYPSGNHATWTQMPTAMITVRK